MREKETKLAGDAGAGTTPDQALLTTPEVCERLRITRGTLYHRIRAGDVPVIRLGARQLFHWPSVEQALLRTQRAV